MTICCPKYHQKLEMPRLNGGRCFVANGGAHILFSGKKCMNITKIIGPWNELAMPGKWGGARRARPPPRSANVKRKIRNQTLLFQIDTLLTSNSLSVTDTTPPRKQLIANNMVSSCMIAIVKL